MTLKSGVMKVMWLDDDIKGGLHKLEKAEVVAVNSCREAEEKLTAQLEAQQAPDWVVVDLIVPQDGWGSKFYKRPGLQYIKHVREKLPRRVGICAYAAMLTPDDEAALRAAGADVAHRKTHISFHDLLMNLGQHPIRRPNV